MIKITYDQSRNEVQIKMYPFSPTVLVLIKRIPGRDYHQDKYWFVPVVQGTELKAYITRFIEEVESTGQEVEVQDTVWHALEVNESFREINYHLSSAMGFDAPGFVRLSGFDLSPTQRATVQYIITNMRGVIVSDVESHNPRTSVLASLEYMTPHCYPALIICADNKKFLWASEFKRRTRRNVYTMGISEEAEFIHSAGDNIETAELAVVNFGNLAKYRSWLASIDFQCLVVDDGQGIQSSTSDQATILFDLGRVIPRKVLLSRTDIHNKPWELITQLEIIERAGEFGGRKKYLQDFTTSRRVAGKNGFAPVWAAKETDDLERRLRELCYVAHDAIEEEQERFEV